MTIRCWNPNWAIHHMSFYSWGPSSDRSPHPSVLLRFGPLSTSWFFQYLDPLCCATHRRKEGVHTQLFARHPTCSTLPPSSQKVYGIFKLASALNWELFTHPLYPIQLARPSFFLVPRNCPLSWPLISFPNFWNENHMHDSMTLPPNHITIVSRNLSHFNPGEKTFHVSKKSCCNSSNVSSLQTCHWPN